MNSEKHIILTISLLFSVVSLLTSTITVSASINNYVKDRYENKFYREKYNENIHRQGALCDDPQATKKYGDICKGHGNYLEGVKDECRKNGGEWENGKCKFEDDEGETAFKDELCEDKKRHEKVQENM